MYNNDIGKPLCVRVSAKWRTCNLIIKLANHMATEGTVFDLMSYLAHPP